MLSGGGIIEVVYPRSEMCFKLVVDFTQEGQSV